MSTQQDISSPFKRTPSLGRIFGEREEFLMIRGIHLRSKRTIKIGKGNSMTGLFIFYNIFI